MEDGTFVGDTLPNFSDLFIGYESRIQAIFGRIVAASSVDALPKLQFTEEHSSMLFKCKPSEASAKADWHEIASLWAMSQGVGRFVQRCSTPVAPAKLAWVSRKVRRRSSVTISSTRRGRWPIRGATDGTPISRNPTSSLIGWSLATYSSSGRSNGS
ncbi:hypothetical protein SAMN05216459_13219 [Ensifer sp. OV372]|nr:hypothetical protein SAMN05216459_13219 [Ensifer sp. OV372]